MHTRLDHIRPLNARAVQVSVQVVDHVTAAHFAYPTPCAGWSLHDLLSHMTAQHRGFAAAARGDGADLTRWKTGAMGPDPAARYRESAAEAVAAFAEVADREDEFTLPEFTLGMPFPAWQAIGFHLVDSAVHAWDVARTVGAPLPADLDLLDELLPLALAVPDGTNRLSAGAAFAPSLQPRDDDAVLDRILRALGRSPAWAA
ncbi:TIGR03086 family metal-binding protein [Yinghuangia seranimata]|uniref:TIGR03086 family metal-binding protein n=1 Tax=Yinghuangia seranimata TaxID=408067 RepID=UPI00248CFAF9|nr:TIGR03086 family metal-binding protein [Yinghuangia seranimata]MDI2129984.1 TIGR03086 family metal-binding protein [Yinghuangia seranimata]